MSADSRALKVVNEFLKSKIKFQLTPLETAPSLPVPIIINSKAYLAFFFFIGKRLNKNEKIKLYRPLVKFVIDGNTARVVNYVDYSVIDEFPESDWQEPIGEFPHPEIAEMTLENYKKNRNELIEKYDEIITDFLENKKDEQLWGEFSQKFYQLCEPALLPYMEKESPSFFERMKL